MHHCQVVLTCVAQQPADWKNLLITGSVTTKGWGPSTQLTPLSWVSRQIRTTATF